MKKLTLLTIIISLLITCTSIIADKPIQEKSWSELIEEYNNLSNEINNLDNEIDNLGNEIYNTGKEIDNLGKGFNITLDLEKQSYMGMLFFGFFTVGVIILAVCFRNALAGLMLICITVTAIGVLAILQDLGYIPPF